MENVASGNNKLDSFVTFERKILTALRSGEITPNEYFVYGYIRLSGNPYGVATTSFENIRNDIFLGKVGISYCNRLLLSLKSKRYIYYDDRRGRRGSFEVHLGDWILPSKEIKTLDAFFDGSQVRGLAVTKSEHPSFDNQNLPPPSKSFSYGLSNIFPSFPVCSSDNELRTPYNDTDTEKNTNKDRGDFSLNGKRIWELKPVSSFNPTTREESRCKDIASGLGEEYINGILALRKEHGIDLLEAAYGICKEDMARSKRIKGGWGAWFTGIVRQLAIQRP